MLSKNLNTYLHLFKNAYKIKYICNRIYKVHTTRRIMKRMATCYHILTLAKSVATWYFKFEHQIQPSVINIIDYKLDFIYV